ncbi:22112_t:CDS:2 [Rhizophagus irregularis]|nr:22112_t:CDS:2 [Rhizophagus irregularis]
MTYGLLFAIHLIGGCLALDLGGLANDNRTTSARLNSASAEKSLGVVLGKVGMT